MAFPPSTALDFVEEDYIGFYNRAGDAPGANFWITQLQSNSRLGVAVGFAISSESLAIYPYLSAPNVVDPASYIAQIYTNVLGRAPDSAGQTFWTNRLQSLSTTLSNPNGTLNTANLQAFFPGTDVTRYNNTLANDPRLVAAAEVLTEMLNAVNQQTGTADANLMANRITVAEDYTARTGANGVTFTQASSHAVITTTTSDAATVPVAEALTTAFIAGGPTGNTFSLTTGIDQGTAFVGGAGNDIYLATLGATPTLNSFDSIDGVGGVNSLNISGTTAGGDLLPGSITLSNIQKVNLSTTTNAGTGAATPFDVSSFSSVTDVSVTSSGLTGDFIKASATANITDTSNGSGNFVQTIGGKAVTVTSSGYVTIGGTTGNPTGAVTVTNTTAPQGATVVSIDGGTAVTVTTKGAGVAIGANVAPTGAVAVTANVGTTAGSNIAADNIAITGGSTVTVTENATTPLLATAGANGTVTLGNVSVTGGAATTAVTVTQTAPATAVNTVLAVAPLTETSSVVFNALTAGQSLTIDGLTFTSTGATTAAQVANAFANIGKGSTQGPAASTLGTYTGVSGGNWTSGAASSTTVLFTSTGSGNVADLATLSASTGTLPTFNETQGIAKVTATGTVGVVDGIVTIADANYGTATANTITTATLSGYGTATISSNALATLSLANSAAGVTVNNNTATALDLTLNKTTGAISIDGGTPAKYATLAVHVAGTSADAITATGVTALTVDGSAVLTATGSTFTALKTVTVSGSAGLVLTSSANVTDINAAATSGAMTVTNFDASKATYEGGTGVDALTLSTTTVSKAITLGDGNDSLTLAAGTTSLTVDVNGGNGTDTLVMNTADAVTGSSSALFAGHVKGFEVLGLNTAGAAAQLIHIDTMGINSVTDSAGTTGVLTLDGFTSGGTLTETGNNAGAISITSSAFTASTTDVFNIVLSKAGALTGGIVDLTNVESATIAANDTTASVVADTNTDTLTLTDLSGTLALKSITATGNAHLTLTVTGDTALTSIDASAMTGGLTVTTAGTVAETVKGGAGSNFLTAAAGTVADTLIGGAGNDTITANGGQDILTGNGGNDLFIIQNGTANVNAYSTITDANTGDRIELANKGTEVFTAAKVSLANTATLQDYANAVVNAGGDSSTNGHIGWFQFGTDTYLVESNHNAVATHDFQNGTDIIVKLTGLIDLSQSSLNANGGVGGASIHMVV